MFITPTHIILGNCGDSRAIVVRDNTVYFGTKDHKPNDPLETQRIQEAGGMVEFGRVCGNLAVSRALGDYQYKDKPDMPQERQKVSADADMEIIERVEGDQFAVLACDGIWDVMSNEQVANYVIQHLKAGHVVQDIANSLLTHCLNKGSKDNMSVEIILMPNAPKHDPSFTLSEELIAKDEAEDEMRRRDESEQTMQLASAIQQHIQLRSGGEGASAALSDMLNLATRKAEDDSSDDEESAGEGGGTSGVD